MPKTLETLLVVLLWVVLSFRGVTDITSNSQTMLYYEEENISTGDGWSCHKFTVLASVFSVGSLKTHCDNIRTVLLGWNSWENEHLCILIDQIRSSTQPPIETVKTYHLYWLLWKLQFLQNSWLQRMLGETCTNKTLLSSVVHTQPESWEGQWSEVEVSQLSEIDTVLIIAFW